MTGSEGLDFRQEAADCVSRMQTALDEIARRFLLWGIEGRRRRKHSSTCGISHSIKIYTYQRRSVCGGALREC